MPIQPYPFHSFQFKDFAEHEVTIIAHSEPEEEPEAPLLPSFSEEELEAVRREAFSAGKEQGRAEAQAAINSAAQEREAQLVALLQTVQEKLGSLSDSIQQSQQEMKQHTAKLALAIARKVAGRAIDAAPLEALETTLAECLSMLAGESRVRITVHPALKEGVETHLSRFSGEGQKIEVLPQADMQKGDCRIEWAGGQAERNMAEIWQEMEAIMQRAFGK